MSTIYFISFLFYLASTISARPAPAIIYSAIIQNSQKSPVQCSVVWLLPINNTLQTDQFTVQQNNYYQVEEKSFDMGSWNALAIINKIQCGRYELSAPFDTVNSPTVDLKFCIQSGGTISVGAC